MVIYSQDKDSKGVKQMNTTEKLIEVTFNKKVWKKDIIFKLTAVR